MNECVGACDKGGARNRRPSPVGDLRPVQTAQGPCWISGVPGPRGALIVSPWSWRLLASPTPHSHGQPGCLPLGSRAPWLTLSLREMRPASCPRGPGPWPLESVPCPPGAWVRTPSPQQPPPWRGWDSGFCFPPSPSAGLCWAHITPEGDVSERAQRASTGSLPLLCPTDPAGQAPGWPVC